MDRERAIEKGFTIKFKPPNLEYCIGELKAIQELFNALPEEEIELSVHAVDGVFELLMNVADKLHVIADQEVGRQIDEAPEAPYEEKEAPDTKSSGE